MSTLLDSRSAALSELAAAADDFARRATEQEGRRDRSRPGTGSQHQHAHSATLWRSAERALRMRILELETSGEASGEVSAPYGAAGRS